MKAAIMNWLPLTMLLLLGACATLPAGPSVMVLPGSGKNFEQFRSDDLRCRQFALEQVGGVSPSQSANQSGVANAVIGTAVGAAAGALMGGESGAAVGAGSGLLFGSMVGSASAQSSFYYTQQWYDNAYIQCMYANGHLVPMSPGLQFKTRERYMEKEPVPPPPPDLKIPRPPPGPPPPPPPGM